MSRVLCQRSRQGEQLCTAASHGGHNRWTSTIIERTSSINICFQTQNRWHATSSHTGRFPQTLDGGNWLPCTKQSLLCDQSRRTFSSSIKQTSIASSSAHESTTAPESPPASTQRRAQSRGILITGGTSGIGLAVARQAIREGASYIRIVTRDKQRGQEVVERLRHDCPTNTDIDYVVASVKEYSEPSLLQTSTTPITTIVHSAGISQTSLLTSTRAEAISTILTTNLESSALLSKSLLKRYIASCKAIGSRTNHSDNKSTETPSSTSSSQRPPQSYQVINISSLLALKGGYGSSIYAASKAGLIALTRTVALEAAEVTSRYRDVGAPGFRANVVLPGYIETAMTKSISGSSREKLIQQIPAGRFGTPEEVADAVMFLVGNEYANNCVLNLDGGLSAA